MTINIMNEYITLTKKQITTYLKLIFEDTYDKRYDDMYSDKYINARYYHFFKGSENTTIRRTILEELRKTYEYAISENFGDKEFIDKLHVFFCYVLYFDNVVYCKDLKNKISQIAKLRKKLLNRDNADFEENLYREMTNINDEKERLLTKFNTDQFFLKISNYKNILNVYRVNLKFELKFPMEYSEMAINKVFNSGITNEDKLVIEYYLMSVQIIRDVIKQNFKKQYIVEFAETLLAKPKKIKSILHIIDNAIIQDKLCLKIRYEYFIENKEAVYELMREGYRFAIILDNSFEANYKNMENLKMFKYVILNKESKQYGQVMQFNEEVKNNIIEI